MLSLRIGSAVLLAATIALVASRVMSQPAMRSEGEHIVEKSCARCHVIQNGRGSWTDAPTFESIANRPGMTRGWLVNFLQKPHMDMLAGDTARAKASSIATYIMSLRAK